MYLHSVEPKNAAQLLGRLRETEKTAIRGANADRLEHLRLNDFFGDGPVSPETMKEVQDALQV